MYTIGDLTKRFNLSRSSLIYYNKIGLLKPSSRSQANYRLYSQSDVSHLEQILLYRDAGLSLDAIGKLLHGPDNQTTKILEQKLAHLNGEISNLRQQQILILKLLGNDSMLRNAKTMSKQQWVKILIASGMDDAAMRQWHIEFERELPEAHTDFLESLGIDVDEISKIKAWSKGAI